MSQITLLFPGQGAQFTGMGQDLCQAYPEAKAVFDLGSQVTGRDLAALCFEGDEATLAKTENAQLAIFAHSMAVTEVASPWASAAPSAPLGPAPWNRALPWWLPAAV